MSAMQPSETRASPSKRCWRIQHLAEKMEEECMPLASKELGQTARRRARQSLLAVLRLLPRLLSQCAIQGHAAEPGRPPSPQQRMVASCAAARAKASTVSEGGSSRMATHSRFATACGA